MTRLLRFGVVGVLGFLVDAGVLMLLVGPGGVDPYLARVPSFLAAATATWLCNRYWTFADRRGRDRLAELRRWLLAMAGGGLVNYAVYAALLATLATVQAWPVLGVAAGSLAGMLVNFASSSRWIFPAGRPAPPG
ncbi:MAG: GtrA family protein [Xanthomonadales bacterium]|nr:GtrA family protein [Xanthomonadales bacterium]